MEASTYHYGLPGSRLSHLAVLSYDRISHPEVFFRKGVLKICSKFTGEYRCRGVISINCKANRT